ncbi:MarR family winged helix-turn-helix transcriptional regulator [Amycolatopsis magusensis]|uniref:MarR family winged helix-turn-helix transcriptional regulator n=1 Tax=Amycolatopsis magusensis TaxID=882444 RepID=UPI0024A8741C|nr:MarR family winged helix-turn-helix transcriptional regulator [Amycolatopsis magusensis]MDI5978958.1 MarR family winged helix-turn-helix transcriptional regulator [Amycolatopsis magusensis]
MPEQRLYFLLQRAAHELRVDADRRCLAAAGLTTAQLGALFAVRETPGLTQRDLARTLGQRESGITAMVQRLTGAGLLARDRHPAQHRAVVLTLTDEGAAALERIRPEMDRFNAELHALLGDGFDDTVAALAKLAGFRTPAPRDDGP